MKAISVAADVRRLKLDFRNFRWSLFTSAATNVGQKSVFVLLAVACFALAGCSKTDADKSDAAPAEDAATPSVVSVQTGALKLATLHRYIQGYGTVEPAPATAEQPAASAQLAAPSAGVVTKVNVVEGQQVKQGDVLAELNSGTTSENAAQQVERQKQLYAQQNTSLKNLQDAEAQLALLRVTAPLSGTVVRVNVKPGQAVDLTTVVAEVMDLNRLVVSAGVPAAAAGELSVGEQVQVLTEPPVTAALAYVSPAVDKNNDTVLVRALLPAESGLRPGQFVPLRIVTAVHTNCLAAPDESVVADINGQSVIALINGDTATQTPVQTGFRENGWAEINGTGLKPGDSVVTVGAYGLPEKTKIQVVNSPGDETSATNSSSSQAQ
jgi:membrane fusion protein (multidrug efflux system)